MFPILPNAMRAKAYYSTAPMDSRCAYHSFITNRNKINKEGDSRRSFDLYLLARKGGVGGTFRVRKKWLWRICSPETMRS